MNTSKTSYFNINSSTPCTPCPDLSSNLSSNLSSDSTSQKSWFQGYWDQSFTPSWECLSSFDQYVAIFILFLVIIIILVLIVTEYLEQDCISGKKCRKRVDPPHKDDDVLTYIDIIDRMVTNNYHYHIWRLSLLSGLIATVPIVYFLRGRIPILIEWIVIGGLIFLATYLAFSWIWAHFFYPNGEEMEKHLRNLRDKISLINSKSW